MDTAAATLRSAIVAAGGAALSDRAAVKALVAGIESSHGDALFGFARRCGLDDAAAEDVVQEGLLRLYDRLLAASHVDDPRAWIFTVVYRLAMDDHRRRERAARLSPYVTPSQSGNDPADVAERASVWAEVDRLPERQRSVLYLRYRADLPFETVGQALGIELECRTQSRNAGNCDPALSDDGGSSLMDERRIEKALRSGPTDEPRHRPGALERGLEARGDEAPPGEAYFSVRLRPRPRPVSASFWTAAVALVAIAVLGGLLILGCPGPADSGPTPSPSPSTSPSTRPAPSSPFPTTALGAPAALIDRWFGTTREIPGAQTQPARSILEIQGASAWFDGGPGERPRLFASSVDQLGPDLLRFTAQTDAGCDPFEQGVYQWQSARRAAV